MAQIFPKWSNLFVKVLGPLLLLFLSFLVFVVWYWFSPMHTDVGYSPHQPVPFSHKLHAGNLGINCKYCHNTIDRSSVASVPPTQTCMNCHATILPESMKLAPVRHSASNDVPIEWLRVHKLGDYVYFPHDRHIAAGVSCKSCHGRVDQMERVKQEKPLSMGWCIRCHKDPAEHLVPLEKVTDLGYTPTTEWLHIAKAKAATFHAPFTDCSGCHR